MVDVGVVVGGTVDPAVEVVSADVVVGVWMVPGLSDRRVDELHATNSTGKASASPFTAARLRTVSCLDFRSIKE